MIKNKLKLYYKVLVQIFFSFLYGKILISKKNYNLLRKQRIKISKIGDYKIKNYHIYKIENARIFTDNNENVAIIKNNNILHHYKLSNKRKIDQKILAELKNAGVSLKIQ